MNTIYAYGGNWSMIGVVLHAFRDIKFDDLKLSTRGPAPSSGSGPYFIARRKVTGLTVDGSEVDLSTLKFWGSDRYVAMGRDSLTRARFLKADGPFYVQLFSADFDHWSGTTLYVRQRYWLVDRNAYSYLFPTTTEGWKSKYDSICDVVESKFSPQYDYLQGCAGRDADVFAKGASFDFKNGELSAFQEIAELGVFPGNTASRFSAAYVDAVDSFDLASMNTLMNIKETVEGIVSVYKVVRHPLKSLTELAKSLGDIRKTAASFWLKYRYQYTTTKLDMKEYKQLIQRLQKLKLMLDKDIHATGSFSDDTGSFRCEIRVKVKDVYPVDIPDWLAAVGIEPTAVNIWDAIPYSFMVDWFFHISDIIEYWDKVGATFDLPVKECWFTYMSNYDGQHVFYRVPGRRMDIPPKVVEKTVSSKTIKMRLADAVSIFLGR